MIMRSTTRRLLLLTALLTACLPVLAQNGQAIGKVLSVHGMVTARDDKGSVRNLTRRADIYAHDTILVGEDGFTQIRMTDSALISFKSNTEFVFNEYDFDGKPETPDTAIMTMVKGGFRTISGSVGHGKDDEYHIDTPYASIGIRGTTHEALLDNGMLYTGVYQGGTTISNNLGTIDTGINAHYDFTVTQSGMAPQGLLEQPPILSTLQDAPAVVAAARQNNKSTAAASTAASSETAKPAEATDNQQTGNQAVATQAGSQATDQDKSKADNTVVGNTSNSSLNATTAVTANSNTSVPVTPAPTTPAVATVPTTTPATATPVAPTITTAAANPVSLSAGSAVELSSVNNAASSSALNSPGSSVVAGTDSSRNISSLAASDKTAASSVLGAISSMAKTNSDHADAGAFMSNRSNGFGSGVGAIAVSNHGEDAAGAIGGSDGFGNSSAGKNLKALSNSVSAPDITSISKGNSDHGEGGSLLSSTTAGFGSGLAGKTGNDLVSNVAPVQPAIGVAGSNSEGFGSPSSSKALGSLTTGGSAPDFSMPGKGNNDQSFGNPASIKGNSDQGFGNPASIKGNSDQGFGNTASIKGNSDHGDSGSLLSASVAGFASPVAGKGLSSLPDSKNGPDLSHINKGGPDISSISKGNAGFGGNSGKRP